MAFQIYVFLLFFFLTLSLALLWRLGLLPLQPFHFKAGTARTTVHRLLKPRTPLDCPVCCLACTPSPGVRPPSAPVRPWSEVKSRRGAALATYHSCPLNQAFESTFPHLLPLANSPEEE